MTQKALHKTSIEIRPWRVCLAMTAFVLIVTALIVAAIH